MNWRDVAVGVEAGVTLGRIDGESAGYRRLGETQDMTRSPTRTWYVYILRCADGSLYTGITTDLTRRIQQHNNGTASRYTRRRRPVKLAYQERKRGQSLALKREAAIKKLTRRQKLALIGSRRSRSG